ncbi:hypothetical protein [Streptomyces sp. NPDC055749]
MSQPPICAAGGSEYAASEFIRIETYETTGVPMKFRATALRWSAATAVAGALMMSTASIAGAAEAREPTTPAGQSIRADQPREAPSATNYAYRGVQGGNLCLVSRCSVGGHASGDNAGPSNTQGFNLCLLAVCSVRP